jgi:hypothetical protein
VPNHAEREATIKGDPDLSVNVLSGCAAEPAEIH